MSSVITVFATFPNMEDASRICTKLVAVDAVASANIIPAGQSIYKNGGMVRLESESVAFLISTEDKLEELIQYIKADHSLETPCITVLPTKTGNEDYLNWVKGNTGHTLAAE